MLFKSVGDKLSIWKESVYKGKIYSKTPGSYSVVKQLKSPRGLTLYRAFTRYGTGPVERLGTVIGKKGKRYTERAMKGWRR